MENKNTMFVNAQSQENNEELGLGFVAERVISDPNVSSMGGVSLIEVRDFLKWAVAQQETPVTGIFTLFKKREFLPDWVIPQLVVKKNGKCLFMALAKNLEEGAKDSHVLWITVEKDKMEMLKKFIKNRQDLDKYSSLLEQVLPAVDMKKNITFYLLPPKEWTEKWKVTKPETVGQQVDKKTCSFRPAQPVIFQEGNEIYISDPGRQFDYSFNFRVKE